MSPEQIVPLVGSSWAPRLIEEFGKPYMAGISQVVQQERKHHLVCPAQEDVFRCLRETPYDKVKVVIIGQDPYHTPGVADGLAFSAGKLKTGDKVPPSLQNIFKELQNDIGDPDVPWDPAPSADLVGWAREGVLLLNTHLTIRAHQPGSHAQLGWNIFTGTVLRLVAERFYPTVFISWGAHAAEVLGSLKNDFGEPLVKNEFQTIISSPHPSPYSANRGFFWSKPFSRANKALKDAGETPINWYPLVHHPVET